MKEKKLSLYLFAFDLLIIYSCFLSVFIYRVGVVPIPLKSIFLMFFVSFAWFLITLNSDIASFNIESTVGTMLKNSLVGYSVLSACVIGIVAIFGNFKQNYKLLLWPLLFSLFFSAFIRLIFFIAIRYFKSNKYNRYVLLIGGGKMAERAIDYLLNHKYTGYKLAGVLSDSFNNPFPKKLHLGKLNKYSEIIRKKKIDEVIIALPLKMEQKIMDIIAECESIGIRVRILPDFFRFIRKRAVMSDLGEITLISIRNEPLSQLKNRFIKRLFDISFSLAILTLGSPVFLLISIIVKITSSGPVFFTQERIGANNIPFIMLKFRTMHVQDYTNSNTEHTKKNDPRITWFGNILRKFSLDELPQFWNVLKGEMSIVGPRPELTHFVNVFSKNISKYKVRHLIHSGITGWAQINGYRGNTSIEKRIEHDIYYIENWSLWMDIKIILLTLFGSDTYKNAY